MNHIKKSLSSESRPIDGLSLGFPWFSQ